MNRLPRKETDDLDPHEQQLLETTCSALAIALRQAERAAPPPFLTQRVMAAIPLRKPGLRGRLADLFQRQLGAYAWLPGRMMVATAGKCHLFFYFVALLHLGMAAVLGMELQGNAHLLPFWIGHQPQLATFLGLLLLGTGMLVARRSRRSRALAQLGLLVYLGAVLSNGLGIAAFLSARGALLAAVAFVGCGLIMGSFLGTILFTCTGERHHA